MKLQRMSNKKVRKRDQKQKNNRNEIISLQYRHNFKIRLKSTLNKEIQGSSISYKWLAMHGLCMANYTLMLFTGVLWNGCSKNVFNIHRKTPVMASFFRNVAGLGLQIEKIYNPHLRVCSHFSKNPWLFYQIPWYKQLVKDWSEPCP